MDGKGRATDNIAIERFWRSAKYENIYLSEYANIKELKAGVTEYRKRRYLGRYFAHPMMQNRRAKRDDYKSSAVRVTQRYVP
ncbi:hypothetical protein PsalMR5_04327 (plasmid) [Piscirickettsia salmonis]|nr:hypothetical protein PsalSR1_04320 [Piscirickettsia salmonis]QGP66402.1 hypothetical protein PsalMR5_04327 [Piscirickettsia salmonis]